MLSVMRRHAGWGLKVILSIIIVSFVFFFGYTKMQKADQNIVMRINGQSIPYNEYKFFYDNQYDQFRQMFQSESGEMPPFVLNSIKAQTQRQLIQRVLLTDLADRLGLQIPDSVLADWIVSNFKTGEDKDKEHPEIFDPLAYKNYLRFFQTKFRLSYENLMAQDLLVQKTFDWLGKVVKPSADLDAQDQALQTKQWTFEKITADKQESAAQLVAAAQKGSIPPALLKDSKAKSDKVGPLTLKDRKRLVEQELSLDQWQKIFALTKSQPVFPEPLSSGGKYVVLRLIKTEVSKTKEKTNAPNSQEFPSLWLQALTQKADIKNYLPEE